MTAPKESTTAVVLPEQLREEVAARISQLERGEVKPVEWSEVEVRIQQVLARIRCDRTQ